jgi:peptide-methionine (S)-S-oxide reductase
MIEQTDSIVLGGGCFWCLDALYRRLKGVLKVETGYAGGTATDPTYMSVYSGTTGHAEVIRVTFDPTVIQLKTLIDVFWAVHDPTTLNKQGTINCSVFYYVNNFWADIFQCWGRI